MCGIEPCFGGVGNVYFLVERRLADKSLVKQILKSFQLRFGEIRFSLLRRDLRFAGIGGEANILRIDECKGLSFSYDGTGIH